MAGGGGRIVLPAARREGLARSSCPRGEGAPCDCLYIYIYNENEITLYTTYYYYNNCSYTTLYGDEVLLREGRPGERALAPALREVLGDEPPLVDVPVLGDHRVRRSFAGYFGYEQ